MTGGVSAALVGGAELREPGLVSSGPGAGLGNGVGVARVSAGVVLRPNPCGEDEILYPGVTLWLGIARVLALTFRTSSSDDVTPPGPLGVGPGVLTFLASPGSGSPAFLARSLRAAAKVDMEEVVTGRPGDGDEGTDCGRTLERSEMTRQ